MKNIFEYQKKYSLSEITKILGDELRKHLKKYNGFSNFKVLTISNKINTKSHLLIKLFLKIRI